MTYNVFGGTLNPAQPNPTQPPNSATITTTTTFDLCLTG